MRGYGWKLNSDKFKLEIRRKVLVVRGIKHSNGAMRFVMDFHHLASLNQDWMSF